MRKERVLKSVNIVKLKQMTIWKIQTKC